MSIQIKLNMILKTILPGLLFILLATNSCCVGAKEEYLGNNLYLSEYDNVDRKILYQTKSCSTSGIEIVPMTVLEISYNSDWIIAKSGNKRNKSDFKYWIIKNNYDKLPTAEIVKKNTKKYQDFNLFEADLAEHKIKMKLEKIE